MVQLNLDPERQHLLESCLIDFQSLLFQESEFAKLKTLHDRIIKQADLSADDIVFIRGILDILITKYRDQLKACDNNPLKYPQDIRKHYANKIIFITALKAEF